MNKRKSVKKKQKVLVLPECWKTTKKTIQRESSRSHNDKHRAKHDMVKLVDSSTGAEHHMSSGNSPEKKSNHGTSSRARDKGAGLDPRKIAARRALSKKKKALKKKPAKKKSSGIPGEVELDRKTRWTEAPSEPFKVTKEERKRLTKLLNRRTKESNLFREKLGESFMVAYKRYRIKITPGYSPVGSEMKVARDAAVLIFLKELTPGRAIAYWHQHIGDFTQLKAVPLRFLASPANLDQVALANDDDAKGTAESKGKGKGGSIRTHAYGDSSALDSRLRIALENEGFEMRDFSDRELMSIQNAARAKSSGKRMFVSSKMMPLVKVAMKELFDG